MHAVTTHREVSVVIPVYKAENSLPELIDRLERTVREHGLVAEIILVNDDSPDRTWNVILSLREKHDNIVGINLMRNYGQHGAVLCGIRAATKPVIVTMDDDLQHRPEDIPVLLAKIDEGYDVVFAAPLKMPHPPWRNFLSVNVKRFLSWLVGKNAVLPPSAYMAFLTDVRKAFSEYKSPDVVLSLIFAWSSTRIATVYTEHDDRKYGETTYTIPKLISITLKLLTAYSIVPLRIAAFIGFFFTLFGIAVFCYAIYTAFTRHTLPGFPFLATLIAIMGGAQLFTIGIIGEYLGLMYRRSLDRPAYVVRSTTQDIPTA